MSPFDDDLDMRRAADERLISGLPVEGEADLERLVSTLRSMGTAPAPAPTAALRAILSDGLPGVHAIDESGALEGQGPDAPDPELDELAARRARRGRHRLALGARVALGAGAAIAIATGAAALEPVPAAIREPVRAVLGSAVDFLTPWSSNDRPEVGTPARDGTGGTDADAPAAVDPGLEPGLEPGDAVTRRLGPSAPGGGTVPPVEVGRPAEPGAPADPGPPVDVGPPTGAGSPDAGPPQDPGAPGSIEPPNPPDDAADRGTWREPYPSPAPQR